MFKRILVTLEMLLFTGLLMGCGNAGDTEMVNEQSFDLSYYKDISIDYDEENITFVEGNGDEMVLREYMSERRNSYFAKVIKGSGKLNISEGSKPFFHSDFYRYIEIYLPQKYDGTIQIHTTSGEINLEELSIMQGQICVDSTSGKINAKDLSALELQISTTSGNIEINKLQGEDIQISTTSGILDLNEVQGKNVDVTTTSGNICCKEVSGNVNMISKSGAIEIASAKGCGQFLVNEDAKLSVNYKEVSGNVSLYNKNSNVELMIPKDCSFHYSGKTKNGTITTDYKDQLGTGEKEISGKVGENPTILISMESRNGDIILKSN